MSSINIPIPEDLKRVIDKHLEVEWTKIAQKALWDHARRIELLEKLVKNSKLTEEEVLAIGDKIKLEIAQKHGL